MKGRPLLDRIDYSGERAGFGEEGVRFKAARKGGRD